MTEIKWPLEAIEPRQVQLDALRAGYGKYGFAYYMRQRLGKTFTAYAEYKLLKESGLVDWMVVICPNTIKQAWADEIERVDEYEPIRIYNSQSKQKVDKWLTKNNYGGVLIINYESLHAFIREDQHRKINPLRTYLVADESIKLADPDAKMTKAALGLAAMCLYTRVMTGKPSKGFNTDLWAQLKFINATERNFYQHKMVFTKGGSYLGAPSENANTEQLKAEMSPHCFIASDKYIDGFKKYYAPLRRITMVGEQKRMYDQMEKDLIAEIYGLSDEKVAMSAPIMLTKYLRLQQIASGLGVVNISEDVLVPVNEHINIVPPENNPRIKEVKHLLSSEIDNKVIIVCRFRKSIENLRQELEKDGHKCSIMIGGMGPELDAQKRLFHEGDHDVCIAQLQVLAYGHTLHGPDAKPCTDMIFYENNFSLDNRAQAESRPEKYKENEIQSPITYWDLYSSDMDKKILQALIRKESASMALMGYARSRGVLPHGANGNDIFA